VIDPHGVRARTPAFVIGVITAAGIAMCCVLKLVFEI
jgi:hypothetical protein